MAGKLSHWLRVFAAPTEDLGSISSTHLRWPTAGITPVPGDLTVSLGTDMHSGKTDKKNLQTNEIIQF